MREWRLLGSVRGVRSNAHSYREQHRPQAAIRLKKTAIPKAAVGNGSRLAALALVGLCLAGIGRAKWRQASRARCAIRVRAPASRWVSCKGWASRRRSEITSLELHGAYLRQCATRLCCTVFCSSGLAICALRWRICVGFCVYLTRRPFRRAGRVSTILTAIFYVIFNRLIHLLGMIDAKGTGSTIVQ